MSAGSRGKHYRWVHMKLLRLVYQDHSLYQAPSKTVHLIFVSVNIYCFSLRDCLNVCKFEGLQSQVHPWRRLIPGTRFHVQYVLHAVSDSSEPGGDETWPLKGTQLHHDRQALTGKARDITQSKGLLSMPDVFFPPTAS